MRLKSVQSGVSVMCSKTYYAGTAVKFVDSVKRLADNRLCLTYVVDCGTAASSSVLSPDAKEFIPSVVPKLPYYTSDVCLYHTAD